VLLAGWQTPAARLILPLMSRHFREPVVVDDGVVTAVGFSAPDVDFTALSDERYLLRTGTRRYVVRVGSEAAVRLRRVVRSVLPKLGSAAPLHTQLTESEFALLRPYLDRFRAMGVLFFPDAEVARQIRDDRDVGLYTFIARRTSTPDAVFSAVKNTVVDLVGPADLVSRWSAVLDAQGLRVRTEWRHAADAPERIAADTGLAVLVSVGDGDRLRAANACLTRRGTRWVPVLFEPATVRVGPFVAAGHSACLACLPAPQAAAEAGDGTPGGYEAGAPPVADGPVARSWLSLQPGAVAWAGGVVAHLALRAFVPMGPDHPWGLVTTIDTLHLGQREVRLWRDPCCPVCADRSAPLQPWVEV
jgi:bacteriocin biosynthesis cyclodehydratase domain-containing protein